jgi:archaellum biogenesis ATPase FlaH
MFEKPVLTSVIKDRAAFDKIERHVGRDDLTEQGWIIWQGVCDYYDKDGGAEYIDAELLAESIARTVAVDKHKEMFRRAVAGLAEAEASPANVVADLLATKRERAGKRLAAALLEGNDNAELLRDYDELLNADGLVEEEEEVEARQGLSVADLVRDRFDRGSLIRVAPDALNDRLDGGVKPGHHLVLFARPEMGKTMVTIEMMHGFLAQDKKVLYVGNEDPMDDINMRVVNRLAHMTKEQVLANPDRADERARAKGYDNLVLASLAPGTRREITALIEEHKPDVLVLDQLRNLNMGQDNFVLSLENAAKQARQWAKRYSCVVVSVTQAGDSAAGKAVLDMGDVDYSNTGIPAQADVMIGIGANKEHAKNGEIVFSLPKNKVSGVHEYFACGVEPHLSKVVTLG